jgi:ribonuclease/clavin/mitogillin
MPTLEPLERVSRLSNLVVRVLGLNPGPFSLQGTNTYLVGAAGTKSRILIDAGEGVQEYVPLLEEALKESGGESISDVVITHYHRDHSEGLQALRDRFGDGMRAWKLDPLYEGEHGPSFSLAEFGMKALADGQVLTTESGDATLRVLATPGHTPDHCCLVLQQERACFSGDCVLGGSSAVFEDLRDYMGSLQRLLGVLAPAVAADGGDGASDGAKARIYPGHGVVLEDGASAVRAYIAHRRAREQQVLDALRGRRAGLSLLGLTYAIYPDLSFGLRFAAAHNTRMTLQKLEADGEAAILLELRCPLPACAGVRLDQLLVERWRLVGADEQVLLGVHGARVT